MIHLIIDIATCPLPNAAEFLDPPSAPANYKDPEKIAVYVAEAQQAALAKAALDPDLGRISAIGYRVGDKAIGVQLCQDERAEKDALFHVAEVLTGVALVGYNSLKFDWPYLMRRAAYLGVPLTINTDRYKTNHIDVLEHLTHRGLLTSKSLGFYAKRLGIPTAKPMSGAEEAQVEQTGRWDDLRAAVAWDVQAIHTVATWAGLLR